MPKGEGRHLTLGDRTAIQQMVTDGELLPDIARKLGVSPSTVSREVQRNAVKSSPAFLAVTTTNTCLNQDACRKSGICGNGCMVPCRKCKKSICNEVCPDYRPSVCPRTARPPFVCNGCPKRYGMGCGFEMRFYDAVMAHEAYTERKVVSRQGLDCTREELEAMAARVRPLLKRGQSPEFIWSSIGGELPISLRTFYSYVERGVFEGIVGLHLPKKVKFKVRKKARAEAPVPRRDLEGRLYSDFQALPVESRLTAVEMDCVCGKSGERPAILTLMFRQSHLQLMLYLPEQTSSEVAKALDMIERLVGYTSFRRLFGTILTDRGSEFVDYGKLERSCVRKNRARCKVFFCDPMKSNQKSLCERNHAELRRIIPKGTSLKRLTPRALAVACSHVNSYGRPVLGGATPYQLARLTVPVELLDGLGIVPIPPEEVSMHPSLIEL